MTSGIKSESCIEALGGGGILVVVNGTRVSLKWDIASIMSTFLEIIRSYIP